MTSRPHGTDEYDFDRFYEVYYPQLACEAYELAGRPSTAHQVTLTAFRYAWRHWDQLTNSDPISWTRRYITAHAQPSRVKPGTTFDPLPTTCARDVRADAQRPNPMRAALLALMAITIALCLAYEVACG